MNKENIFPFQHKQSIFIKKPNSNQLQLSFSFPMPLQKTPFKKENQSQSEKPSTPSNSTKDEEEFTISKEDYSEILNAFMSTTPIKKEQIFLGKKHKKFTIAPKQKQALKQKYIIYKHKKLTSNNESFSILTYNILNQIYMKKQHRDDLKEDIRMDKIQKEILALQPDIFCLQEADLSVYTKYFSEYNLSKYSTLYGVNCGSCFLNVIGFKKGKFVLKSFKNFSLSFLGKNAGNRGIMNVQLEAISTKKMLSVYNVHFPWKFESDRIKMIKEIFEHLNTINDPSNFGVCIVGDFNSVPNSDIIKIFYYDKFLHSQKKKQIEFPLSKNKKEENTIDYKALKLFDEIYHKFKLKSAYQSYTKEKNDMSFLGHPLFTARTQFYKRTIDYIFFSDKIMISKILKLPKDYEVEREKFLPSKFFPSDHLKLYAEFSFDN